MSRDFSFPHGLSVVFLAQGDSLAVEELVLRTFSVLSGIASDYEVILVGADAPEYLIRLENQYRPQLRMVTPPAHADDGVAVRAGFLASKKEFVFFAKSSGEYDPADLEKLLRAAGERKALINGYRPRRADSIYHKGASWLYNRLARSLYGVRLTDAGCEFRLIRRSVLQPGKLRARGSAISLELVKVLEMSGCETAEVPVGFYPQTTNLSLRGFWTSLTALWHFSVLYLRSLFWQQVPVSPGKSAREYEKPGVFTTTATAVCISLLSLASYGWSLRVPFISDDYVQIQMARDLIPHWGALLRDTVHRWQIPSLLITYGIDQLFGMRSAAFNGTSLFLHICNCLLVFALGMWRPIGWKLAAVAACLFAFGQRKNEAVVWFAAIPELLMFFFALGSFLLYVAWLQAEERPWRYYLGALAAFGLAIVSREAAMAVIPLFAIALVAGDDRRGSSWRSLVPFILLSAGCFLARHPVGSEHLELMTGAFWLRTSYSVVLLRSSVSMLGIWGAAAGVILIVTKRSLNSGAAWIAVAWTVLCLVPESLATDLPIVPSRYMYFGSVGRAILIACGFFALQQISFRRHWRWAVSVAAVAFFLHESLHLWLIEQPHYLHRAEVTEKLVKLGNSTKQPIYATCFPYSPVVAEDALRARTQFHPKLIIGPEAANHPGAVDFCNEDAFH